MRPTTYTVKDKKIALVLAVLLHLTYFLDFITGFIVFVSKLL